MIAVALAGESLKSQPDPDFTPEQRGDLYARCHRSHPGGGIMPTDSAPMVIALGEAYTEGDKGLPQNAVIAVQSPPILRRIDQSACFKLS